MIISKDLNEEIIAVLDNLIIDLGEAHAVEKDAGHYGDDGCKYCDDIVAGSRLLNKLQHLKEGDLVD